MSSVTTTKVDTANGATNLILTTGNTSGPSVVVTTGTDIQLNGNTVASKVSVTSNTDLRVGTFSIGANGYSYLPNGLLLQWGKLAVTTSGATITFSTPFSTGALSIQLTGTADSRPWVTSLSSTTCGIDAAASSDVYYQAIGY